MNIAAVGLMVTFGALAISVLSRDAINPEHPLSRHVASSPRTILYGKVGLTAGGVFLFIALVLYAAPKYGLGTSFITLGLTACLFGTATGYLPYGVSKRQDLWHDIFSYGYVILNPLILGYIAIALQNGPLKTAYLIGIAGQVAILGLLVVYPSVRRYFLWFQLVYLSIFGALLILA